MTTIVTIYDYDPLHSGEPLFTVIDRPICTPDYVLQDISGPVKFYKNYSTNQIKVYFDPDMFPPFEIIAAVLDETPREDLSKAFTHLRSMRRAELAKCGITQSVAAFICFNNE